MNHGGQGSHHACPSTHCHQSLHQCCKEAYTFVLTGRAQTSMQSCAAIAFERLLIERGYLLRFCLCLPHESLAHMHCAWLPSMPHCNKPHAPIKSQEEYSRGLHAMAACLHLPQIYWHVRFSTHLLSVEPAPLEERRGDTPEVGHIVLIQTPLHRHQPMQHLQRPSWSSQKRSPAHSKCSHNHQSQLGDAKNLCDHSLISWHTPDRQETSFA